MTTWKIDQPQRLAMPEQVRQLDVWLASGKLNVVGTDGDARVEVTKVGSSGMSVSLVDGVLSVKHEFPSHRWRWLGPLWWFGSGRRRFYGDVSIAVPRKTAGSLTMVAGSVLASGLDGATTVDVVSGGITLMGLTSQVRAKTVSGSIQALGTGGDLSMETISGEITLADSSAVRVHARTISGAITCDMDNPYASDIRLDTTSGEITARVPEDADLSVQLSATSGRINSAFPAVRPSGPPGARSASGRLGAGTGRLYAYAISGNVNLLARPAADLADNDDGEAAS